MNIEQLIQQAVFPQSQLSILSETEQTQYPYLMNVLLRVKGVYSKQSFTTASGTLVFIEQKWCILTAAHNFYDKKQKRFYDSVQIYFSRKNNAEKKQSITMKITEQAFLIDSNYTNVFQSNIPQLDLAFIDLNQNKQFNELLKNDKIFTDKLGFFYNFNVEQANKQNKCIMISGFPAPKQKKKKVKQNEQNYENKRQKIQQNFANQIKQYKSMGNFYLNSKYKLNNNQFGHKVSTKSGMSGSAIFVEQKIKIQNINLKVYKIIGIHLNGVEVQESLQKKQKSQEKKYICNLGICLDYQKVKNILNKSQNLFINDNIISKMSQSEEEARSRIQIQNIQMQIGPQQQSKEQNNQNQQLIKKNTNTNKKTKLKMVNDLKAIKNPYCSIVLLQIYNGNSKDPGYGTGTLIKLKNEYYILTAAHNIYDRKNSCYYQINAHYYYYSESELLEPTLRNNINYLKLDIYDNEYRIRPQYKNLKTDCITYYDIGLIKCKSLNCWPNIRVMQIFYGWKTDNKEQKSKILISGYSLNQKKSPSQLVSQYMNQYQSKGYIKIIDEDLFLIQYQMQLCGGHSGSPIIVKHNKQFFVIGIHIGVRKDNPLRGVGRYISSDDILDTYFNKNTQQLQKKHQDKVLIQIIHQDIFPNRQKQISEQEQFCNKILKKYDPISPSHRKFLQPLNYRQFLFKVQKLYRKVCKEQEYFEQDFKKQQEQKLAKNEKKIQQLMFHCIELRDKISKYQQDFINKKRKQLDTRRNQKMQMDTRRKQKMQIQMDYRQSQGQGQVEIFNRYRDSQYQYQYKQVDFKKNNLIDYKEICQFYNMLPLLELRHF